MIKKLKIGLLITVLSLAVGISSAYAADLTWSADTTVTIGSDNYTIYAGSAATSMVVGATTLVVTVPASSTFTLASSDRYVLNNDASLVPGCTFALSNLTINGSTTPGAVTITPDNTATCTVSGGGSYTPPPVVIPPVTPVTPPAVPAVEPGCSSGNMYNTSTGALCVNNAGPTIPGCGNRTTGFSTALGTSCALNRATTGMTYNFGAKTLKNGSRGDAVMELQRFLNAKLNLSLVIDGKLGPKTIKVIKQWQKDNGLVDDGLIGAKTKAKMNLEAESN